MWVLSDVAYNFTITGLEARSADQFFEVLTSCGNVTSCNFATITAFCNGTKTDGSIQKLNLTKKSGGQRVQTKPHSINMVTLLFTVLFFSMMASGVVADPLLTEAGERLPAVGETTTKTVKATIDVGTLRSANATYYAFECNGVETDLAGWNACEHRVWLTGVELPFAGKISRRQSDFDQPTVGWYWGEEHFTADNTDLVRRFCTKVERAETWNGWDVALTPILGNGVSATMTRGKSVSENINIGVNLSGEYKFKKEHTAKATVGFEYTRTWSSTDDLSVGFGKVQRKWGVGVVNPKVHRTFGLFQMVEVTNAWWERDPCTEPANVAPFSNADRYFDGPGGFAYGQYLLCESDSHPIPFCTGSGTHW
jgi:hypothetical protein